MIKDIRNNASHENARLIVENAKLRDIIKKQQEAIFAVEELAINGGYKSIMEVTSIMRNSVKGENYYGIYT